MIPRHQGQEQAFPTFFFQDGAAVSTGPHRVCQGAVASSAPHGQYIVRDGADLGLPGRAVIVQDRAVVADGVDVGAVRAPYVEQMLTT